MCNFPWLFASRVSPSEECVMYGPEWSLCWWPRHQALSALSSQQTSCLQPGPVVIYPQCSVDVTRSCEASSKIKIVTLAQWLSASWCWCDNCDHNKVRSSLAVTSGDVWGLGAAPLISPGPMVSDTLVTTGLSRLSQHLTPFISVSASDWSVGHNSGLWLVSDITMWHHSMSQHAHITLN